MAKICGLLGLAGSVFISCVAFARSSEDVRVIQVLTGDTLIVGTYTSPSSNDSADNSRYVYIAACRAPTLNEVGGLEAKQALTELVEGKLLTLVSAASSGNKTLGSLYLKQTQDVCSILIKHGYAFFAPSDSSYIGSVQRGGYQTFAGKAKASRVGLWRNLDPHYLPTPRAWADLQLEKVQQPYVNGTSEPILHGLGRDDRRINPKGLKKDPNDWRTR